MPMLMNLIWFAIAMLCGYGVMKALLWFKQGRARESGDRATRS